MLRQAVSATKAVGTATGVSQDNIIFGLVLLAFVVYITVKGELPIYLGFFTPQSQLGPATDTVAATSASGTTAPAGSVQSVVQSIPGANLIPGLSGSGGTNSILPSWMTTSIPSMIGNWFKGL